MVGWVGTPTAEKAFLKESVRQLPEYDRLTGERPRRRGALRRRGVNGLGTGFAGITINHEVLDRIGAINVAGCGTGGLTTVSIEPISLC
jgi:hypothetical protein